MSFLSSLFDWFKAIIKKIVKFIKDFIKEFWWIIVLVLVIYFAPAIGAWLSANGASWLGSAFSWVGTNITPMLTSGLSSLWNGATSLAAEGWSAFKAAEMGTKLSILAGAGTLIAPEETAVLLSEAADAVITTGTSVLGNVLGSVGDALVSSPLGIAALAFGAWYFFIRDDDETTTIQVQPQPRYGDDLL